MFGSEDVIYVPEGGLLRFHDVYGWKRYSLDVRRFGLHIRPFAFEEVAGRARSAQEVLLKVARFSQRGSELQARTDALLRGLAGYGAGSDDGDHRRLSQFLGLGHSAAWLRVTDGAAESFHEDDYERVVTSPDLYARYGLYGSVEVSHLDNLEVQLPGDGEEGLPFMLDVPSGGLVAEPMPVDQPLPLLEEFCGAGGASSRGNSINLQPDGQVAPNHQFCTPLGRVSETLFATLYFNHNLTVAERVSARLRREAFGPLMQILERSRFAVIDGGDHHRIYARKGDVVHLYQGLPGREAAGSPFLPPLLFVAQCAGETTPEARADLLQVLLETLTTPTA